VINIHIYVYLSRHFILSSKNLLYNLSSKNLLFNLSSKNLLYNLSSKNLLYNLLKICKSRKK